VTSTYDAGSQSKAVFDYLNNVRDKSGVGVLRQNAALDTSANAHANYITLHPDEAGHMETEGEDGFTGMSPSNRNAAAGYMGFSPYENLALYPGNDGLSCVKQLLDTVYHLADLLEEYRDVGVAFRSMYGSSETLCVLEGGWGDNQQLPAHGAIANYPFDGQTDVASTFTLDWEIPRPLVSVPSGDVGQPIFASFQNQAWTDGTQYGPSTVITKFSLTDAAGNDVPGYLLVPNFATAGPGLQATPDPENLGFYNGGHAWLVPKSPLTAGMTYHVAFEVQTFSTTLSKSWSFTVAH
jgi:hypothetical protein